jgi:hypothetical protein
MADPRSAEAAWAAALAAWQSIYVKETAPLGGMLADEVSVPLDPFPSDGHRPCWCPCTKAHPGEAVCDMEGVVSRPAASAAVGTVNLHVCIPCWTSSGIAGMTGG